MRTASVIAFFVLSVACADVGRYVWVNDYAQARPTEAGFVISAGDMVLVRVYNQEQLTTRARVRTDGRLTLPLLNDVDAAGYSPTTLGQQLETRYKEFLKLPVVTVAIEEVQPLLIPVGGEVLKPGLVSVDRSSSAGVLQVLIASGGLTEYAHRDRVFVLRRKDLVQRIRFTWEALTRGEERAVAFALQPGDSVLVE